MPKDRTLQQAYLGLLTQNLGSHQFHNNEELEMAVGEWVQMHEPDLYCNGIFKLMPKCDKCINTFKEYDEK
jgi:hypothetical protein